MAGFKSRLKLLALRQQRYAKNLNNVNGEITKLLEEQGISYKDINNNTILMCEPEIITEHLFYIADNFENTKNFNIDTILNINDKVRRQKSEKQ